MSDSFDDAVVYAVPCVERQFYDAFDDDSNNAQK